jgi:glycosidase
MDLEDVFGRNGALQDAAKLIEAAHTYDFKVVIDFPVAVTSTRHEWFRRSAKASLPGNETFATYYFWKRNVQPSEFVSYYNETGNVYYHVEDHPELPVLNYGAPNVSRAVKVSFVFCWGIKVCSFRMLWTFGLKREWMDFIFDLRIICRERLMENIR